MEAETSFMTLISGGVPYFLINGRFEGADNDTLPREPEDF